MSLYDFLKEVYIKIEDSEDKELLSFILEAEKDDEISSEDFLSSLDVHLNETNRK